VATHSTINDSATFEMMTTIDFFFDKGALKKMYKDILVYENTLAPVDFSNQVFRKGITGILGKEKSDKAIADLELYGTIKKFPEEFSKTLMLTNVQLKYDERTRSFISVGKIGIGSVNESEVYKQVPGYIQVIKKKGGDTFNMYFELDPQTWYFFSYIKGVMSVVSSNAEFNNDIKNMKPKDRKQEVKSGPGFQYTIASPEKRKQFLRKMNMMNASEE
jgi:hypothetical protein